MRSRWSQVMAIMIVWGALAVCGALAGCGKTLSSSTSGRTAPQTEFAGAGQRGMLATRNTTRLSGADGSSDAAAIAETVYPGLTPSTRPLAVVLVDENDWTTALAAATLTGPPLHAPLLYTHVGALAASAEALRVMKPTGAAVLGGAQVISVRKATSPPGYSGRAIAPENDSAAGAVAIERFASRLRGRSPRRVIVTSLEAEPAMTMPAAGLSAHTEAPILFVERSGIPPATAQELRRLKDPSIYIVGPTSIVSAGVESELRHFGHVTRIAGVDPAMNAIAVARFSDGTFGWGVLEPGHGLAIANARQPLDAPAGALLAATGDYAPLLLVESPDRLPPALTFYLHDLQPGTPPAGAVYGVYNHGWLIGDESAISATVQAQLDSLLEISSRSASEPSFATSTTSSSEPTQTPSEP